MTLLPHHYETFVLTQPAQTVVTKIASVSTSRLLLQNQEGSQYVFTGWVREDRFRISMKVNRPNNYLPLVKGKIESTSSGSLLFLNYVLFPSTKMFLLSWNLFILLIGLIASYQYGNLIYGASAVSLVVLIFWIAWSNFKIQLKLTRQLLLDVLS